MKNFSLRISNLILTFFADQNKNFIEIAQTSNTKPIRIPNKFQPPTHPKFHPKFQTSHKNRIITTQKTDLSAKWAKQWVAPGVVQQVPSSRVHSTKRGRTRWPRSRSTISTSYDQGGYFEHTHASGVQCSANLARISANFTGRAPWTAPAPSTSRELNQTPDRQCPTASSDRSWWWSVWIIDDCARASNNVHFLVAVCARVIIGHAGHRSQLPRTCPSLILMFCFVSAATFLMRSKRDRNMRKLDFVRTQAGNFHTKEFYNSI